uniref:Uncharacterized protein n=1 Tax=Lynx canadensis TaxID=61383 RepID=A0A667INT8_LYNCA
IEMLKWGSAGPGGSFLRLLGLVSATIAAGDLTPLHCLLGAFCKCHCQPSFQGLERDLTQHLAGAPAVKAPKVFAQDPAPDQATGPLPAGLDRHWQVLCPLPAGALPSSGVASAARSRAPLFPAIHFPHPSPMEHHEKDLKSWVQGNLTACSHSPFLLDEMDKLLPTSSILSERLGKSITFYKTGNAESSIFLVINLPGIFRGRYLQSRRVFNNEAAYPLYYRCAFSKFQIIILLVLLFERTLAQ